MNVLKKILEEIENIEKEYVYGHHALYALGATGVAFKISNIIRSYMNEAENGGWIPVSERLPEEGKEVLTQFVIRVRNRNNKVNEEVYIYPLRYEKGTWQSFAGVPNGEVEAWQPLPDPYKPEEG